MGLSSLGSTKMVLINFTFSFYFSIPAKLFYWWACYFFSGMQTLVSGTRLVLDTAEDTKMYFLSFEDNKIFYNEDQMLTK